MRGKWWNLSRTHGAQGLSPEPVSLATEIYCLENGESKGLTVESGEDAAETAAVGRRAVGSGGAQGEAGGAGRGLRLRQGGMDGQG